MRKWLKTNAANILTMTRIAGAILLLFVLPLSPAFYIIYTLSGITDALDGWVARKTHTMSSNGARLDSIADLSFFGVTLARLLPALWQRLPLGFWLAVAFVFMVRLCSYTVAFVKYRRFASLHTYGNKLTGFMLYFLPYLMSVSNLLLPCCAICAVSGVASVEELLIHLRAKEHQPDTKTLFKAI